MTMVMSMALIQVVVLLVAAAICTWKWMNRNKSSAPGPPAIPIVGHLHLLMKPNTAPHTLLQSLSRRYGPIMSLRFGSVPIVVASTPASAKEFLKTHDAIFASRPPAAAARIYFHDADLVFAPYGDRWRQLRRLATLELFTARRIDMFRDVRREEVRYLCSSILRSCSNLVDLRANLNALTFNLITFMLMGKRYFGEKVEDGQEATHFIEAINGVFRTLGESPVGDYFPFLRFLDPAEARMKHLAKTTHAFLEAHISEHEKHRKSSEESMDLLDVMLALRDSGEDYLEGKNLIALMMNLLSAAPDTSAVLMTMEWTLAEMIKNPAIMAKAQHEIHRVVGPDRMVEESDIPQLNYLQAIVKESFRLHPVVPLLVPHRSTRLCTVMGYQIQPGTTLLVNAYAIARDPSMWEDPLLFNPERFLDSEVDVKGEHFELLPFGAGRRMCPGMALALTTIHLTLANLVHGFNWKQSPDEPINTMSEQYGFTLSMAKKLQAIPSARLPAEAY